MYEPTEEYKRLGNMKLLFGGLTVMGGIAIAYSVLTGNVGGAIADGILTSIAGYATKETHKEQKRISELEQIISNNDLSQS